MWTHSVVCGTDRVFIEHLCITSFSLRQNSRLLWTLSLGLWDSELPTANIVLPCEGHSHTSLDHCKIGKSRCPIKYSGIPTCQAGSQLTMVTLARPECGPTCVRSTAEECRPLILAEAQPR